MRAYLAGSLRGRLDALDTPILHERDVIGEAHDAVVVGHDDHGAVRAPGAFGEKLHDRVPGVVVERRGGLVAEDEVRFVDEGAGDGHPLLLAPRELRGKGMGAFGEAELRE